MTILIEDENDQGLGFGLCAPDRDWPLSFRWRAEEAALAQFGLPARNNQCEDARAAILTEAVMAADSARWVSFSRRREFYAGRRRYQGNSFTFRNVLAAIGDAIAAGLLTEERAAPGSRGRQSRMKANRLLCEKMRGSHVEFQLHEVIWLKDCDGKLIPYGDDDCTCRMRHELEAINHFMSEIDVDVVTPAITKLGHRWIVDGTHLILTPPHVRRVFNRGSFDFGGRAYGWWQGLPSRYRTQMTINGEPVLEPDYAQLHAQIIYAKRELPLRFDAYETGEFPRDHGKSAFNIALNAASQRAAIYAIADALKIERQQASKLLNLILAKHKRIADMFCSDAGVRLMRIDSDIAIETMKLCQSKGIAVLPIHDSFATPCRHADMVIELMKEAFAIKFPMVRNCEVRIKTKNGSTDGRENPFQAAA